MRENKLEKIIKAENLLQEGVDPRKIFSSLRGEPRREDFDHYTVYLPCVGYNWIVREGERYKLLSRDLWYGWAGIFKNGRCKVEMKEDKNWINEEGKLIRPNGWLEGVQDFNTLGVAIGRLDGKLGWFDKEGKELSESRYQTIREVDQDPSLYIIHERGIGFNISKSDGNPIFPIWYNTISFIHPKEKTAVVSRENLDSIEEFESCILDLDSGKELCEWYTWIGGFEALTKWGIVVQREVGNEDRFNFINAQGKLYSPREWYRKNRGGNLVDSSGNIIEKPI